MKWKRDKNWCHEQWFFIRLLYLLERMNMSKYITALTLAVTTLMLSACAMHGTWAFSGVMG